MGSPDRVCINQPISNFRPSPRDLSQAFMKGADGLGSLRNRTAMQTFFGQVGLVPIVSLESAFIALEDCNTSADKCSLVLCWFLLEC